jgi:hypothetical protein
MAVYRPDIPPHVAEIIRHLPPELKQRINRAIRSLNADPSPDEPLIGELSGLWSFKVLTISHHLRIGSSGAGSQELRHRPPAGSL